MNTRKAIVVLSVAAIAGFAGCKTASQSENTTREESKLDPTALFKAIENGLRSPSEETAAQALKEALSIGAQNASATASQADGFFKNDKIRIGIPAELAVVQNKVKDLGFGDVLDPFVKSMNTAAEQASKEAGSVFLKAIQKLTIQDAIKIVRGGDGAATQYLKDSSTEELKKKMRAPVKASLTKAKVTQAWNSVSQVYNKIPGTTKVNPSIEEHVLDRTLDGIFTLVAEEEKQIRENPLKRSSDVLRAVFGWADSKR